MKEPTGKTEIATHIVQVVIATRTKASEKCRKIWFRKEMELKFVKNLKEGRNTQATGQAMSRHGI